MPASVLMTDVWSGSCVVLQVLYVLAGVQWAVFCRWLLLLVSSIGEFSWVGCGRG